MNGKIQYFTNDSFVISIFQTAIQFSAIMQLFGDQAARLFSWSHGAIIILFGILLAEKAGLSKQARLYLFLLLVTSTAFIDVLGDGKVELAGFSPIMAAIYWMLVEAQTNTSQKSILFLVGFLLGLAMVARPYNVILAGGFSGLFYLQCTLLGSWKTFAGIPPTTKHLAELVERMRAEHVGVIIASPYYDVRHAEKVAEATGAFVARLTHQTGGMPGTDDYIAMIDSNVRTLVGALERARGTSTP